MNRETMIDQEARQLLRPLAGEPPEPSRLDVARAMDQGRRRRRTRWWATGTAVVALSATSVTGGTLAVSAIDRPEPLPPPRPVVSASAPVASEPADCSVTRLPTDGVEKAVVTGGDPSGRYLAGRLYRDSDESFPNTVVVWRDGRIFARPRIPGSAPEIADMNADGLGVGSAFRSGGATPYAYRDGTVTRLKGGKGLARAVNPAGVIVGQVNNVAARWKSVTAAPERLTVPAGTRESEAIDIDASGAIIGTVDNPGKAARQTAYLWRPDGTGDYLPLPALDGVRADFFWPAAMSNGWVAGRAGFSDGSGVRFMGFRYRVDIGEYQRLPDDAGLPAGVAANGWVLGEAREPVIVSGTVVVLLPGYRNEMEYQLTSFSNDGLVAGGHSIGFDESVTNQPLWWRCKSVR